MNTVENAGCQNPLVSVIVPVFNAEKYLATCLDSLLAQTYECLEIILVDDGSTDASGVICDEYARRDTRVRVFHKENGGVSSARNKGLGVAGGEFVMFLDSDDWMHPEMCEVMLSEMAMKNADCVVCGCEETGGSHWSPKHSLVYTKLDDFKQDFPTLLGTELLSPVWNKIFKKNLISKTFPEDVSFGEDLIFNLDYFKNCSSFSFLSKELLFHEKGVEGSLVSAADVKRLLDIETVQVAVCEFSEGIITPGKNEKYIRDLCVYARQFLKTATRDCLQRLEDWRSSSAIGSMNACSIQDCWQNKLLLLFLKGRLWKLAALQVNKKPIRRRWQERPTG